MTEVERNSMMSRQEEKINYWGRRGRERIRDKRAELVDGSMKCSYMYYSVTI